MPKACESAQEAQKEVCTDVCNPTATRRAKWIPPCEERPKGVSPDRFVVTRNRAGNPERKTDFRQQKRHGVSIHPQRPLARFIALVLLLESRNVIETATRGTLLL